MIMMFAHLLICFRNHFDLRTLYDVMRYGVGCGCGAHSHSVDFFIPNRAAAENSVTGVICPQIQLKLTI